MRTVIRVTAVMLLVSLAISAASFTIGELALLSVFGLGTFALAGMAEKLLTRSMLVR